MLSMMLGFPEALHPVCASSIELNSEPYTHQSPPPPSPHNMAAWFNQIVTALGLPMFMVGLGSRI